MSAERKTQMLLTDDEVSLIEDYRMLDNNSDKIITDLIDDPILVYNKSMTLLVLIDKEFSDKYPVGSSFLKSDAPIDDLRRLDRMFIDEKIRVTMIQSQWIAKEENDSIRMVRVR